MNATTQPNVRELIQNLPTLDEVDRAIEERRLEIAELRKLRSVVRLRAQAEDASRGEIVTSRGGAS